MHIRQAQQEDIQDFLRLFRQIEAQHRELLPRKYSKPEEDTLKEDFFALLNTPEEKIFFLENEDKHIIGYIQVAVKHAGNGSTLKERDYLEISTLVIDEKERRKGYGEQLLLAVENFAREQNIFDIQLNVWGCNSNANAFYQKQDYLPICQFRRKVLKY
ncbi:MAG: hypothetical protein DLD55_01645 [candidate division SR1 bacterium]|nr:MAG: hypothetical protein DLD55_01645 [candidate division SR1 bacterium]